MNAQFQVAQLSGSTTSGSNAAPTRIFRLSKPLGDQAVVVNLGYDQKAKVDFSAIANEKITLVHVGDKLIILFDNKSTVTVEPFFDSRHDALGNLSVEVAPGREVSVNEFASLFPITTDQSVLPAAGEGGNAQGSGANFSDSAVDPLASRNPLDLLGQEELGNFRLTPEIFAGVPDNNLAPSGSFTISGALLVHDETIGVQPTANDQANPLPAVFQQAGLIGWAESAAPIIASATFDFGSNGPGSVAYVLTTAAGGAFNGVDSGLQATATGNRIFLFTEGPLVVAREGNGATPNAGGAIAFELYLDPVTLKLSVAQYEAIQHSNGLDANDRTDLADVVFVQQVVTDGQGIVVTEVSTSPVGVAFDDDGPAIQVTVAESDREGPTGLETLVLDESTGNDPHGVFPHGTVDDTGFTAPDPTGTNPIGRLETSAGGEEQGQGALQALFNVVKDPGTDGEKSTAYQYSFTLTGGSGPSGSVATTLEVTDPNNLYFDDTIYLFKVSDTEIVGHVGNDPNGPIAIRITLVNADSLSGGQLVVEQYMAIDHGQDGNNFDSSKWLTLLGGGEQGAASLGVTLTATITDGDNDTATSSATILIAGNGESSSIVFQDDGPVLVGDKVVIAVVDEDGLPGHNVDAGRPGEVAGTGSAVATGSLASLVDFGTDGAGANAFHLATLVAPVDTGLTSKGGHVLIVSDGTTLHGYVESGNGSGFTAGDREIFTLTVGPDGSYTFTLKDQVDHPTLNNAAGDNSENPLAATLDLSSFIVATDGDGDFVNLASGTFKVDVQDDIPVLTSGTVSIVVDEDDINTAWSQGTSPSDGSGDGSLTEGSTGAAIVTGSLAGLVSTGADEPGTFAFSADAIAQLTALGLFSKQTAQGDGQNGKPLFYQTSSGGPNEIVITGYEPNPSGNPVLSLTLNTVTGAYEFRLYDELIHVAGDGQNTDLRSGLPLDGIQASVPNIDFGSIITFTDRDGDQVTLSGKFTVTITDDVPQADIDIGHGSVTIDETPGNQADDTTSSSVRNLFANLEATFVDGVRLVGDDPDVAGDNNGSNSGNGAIAYAHSDFAVVVNDSVIGSDSPPYPHQFTLSVTNGNGTPSGLFVTDGSPINLSMKDGLVIGTVVGGQFDGKVAFAIAIGADGEVSVAQYLSIKHDDRGDSNESNDNGSNSNDASPDDPSTIQQTLNGKITATLTVTDSDGDQSSNSVNIGNLITFLDDGPSVEVKVVHDAHLIHDETPGIDAADDDVAGTTAFAGSTLASVFSAVDTPRGDDPHVADNPIGYALTSGAVFSFSTQNYGADGAAAVKPIQYELVLSSNNVHSGLKTTDGRDIHLFKEGNLIVGRYEVGGNNSPDGSPDEVAAFAISIDAATGQLAMVQYVSLDHPNDGNPDDTVQLDDGTLSVKVTLTDGDGDPASDTVDISCVIQFEDDGPTLVGSATLSIAVDEDGLATGNADAGRAGETLGTGSAVASGAAGALNALVNFGADGPGSAAFSLAVQSSPVNTGLESKGGDVFIVSDGTTLRGYVNLGGNSGYQAGTDREVFTLTVGSNGSYTFTLKDQIDHPSLNGWSGDNAENLLSSSIDLSKYIVATDGDGDSVKLGNGTFVVQIRDDIPIQTSGSVSGTVEEDDLNNAYSVGNNEDGSSGKTVATGSLTSLVKVGADENGTFTLDSNGITALQGQNLTSHGTTLTYSISGDTLTAKAGAVTVFTLQIQSNGSYTFTLKDQLDHAAGNGENTLSINLSSVVRFTDYDSDSVTLSGGFSIIVQDDVPTTASNTLVAVDEDDLAAGNHDAAAGDDVTPVSPVTGTLQFSIGADNPATVGFASLNGTAVLNTSGIAVTAAGVALVYLWDSSTNTLYATPDGTSAHAAFQIQVTNTATGAYSFSLLGPVDHPGRDADGLNNGPETAYEDNININLTYTVTDRDGDFKTGTLSVSIDDDVPMAVAGAALTVLETDGATTGINLLANDTRGADGATVTAVDFGLGSGFQAIAAVGTTTITNVNGTYTFQANGTWTFDPSVNASNSNTTGNFTYRITDGDGDTSTVAQVVNITNANSIPTAGSKFLTVDEDGLPNGIAASQPGDVAASFITLSGTLGHNFGPDGPAASDPINFSPMDNGSHTTPVGISSGGVALKYYWDDAGDTLYASTNTTSLANAQSTAAFKVELNTATGGFTYTQLKPVDHPGHDADRANNGPETSYEDNLVVNLSYQVKDSNGDTATGTISVTINDDSPAAAPIVKTVTEGASDTNILLILDRSGSMGFDSGVSGYATRLDLLKAAANQLLDQYDAAGDVRVQIIQFNNDADKQGNVWLSVADAKTYINGLTADNGTDYDDATALASDAFDDPGKLTTPGVRNVSYFISDGQPEPTSEQVLGSELTNWINFVNANDIVSYAIGLGSSAPDTYLDPLAYDGRGTGSGTDTDALIVTNLNQLQSTLVGTVNPSISGSLIDGSIPTSFGADGGYVKSIAIGGKTYSYSPTTDQITESSSGGQSAYSFNTTTNKLTITFSGSAGESFVIDLDDGTYVYTPPTSIVADFSRPFTYTLTDNDGDTVSSTLTINIDNVNGAPVLDANASPFLVAITEDAVAPSGAVGTLVSSLVDLTGGGGINNVTDADGPDLGIAITGTNSANGTWFYSTNGGTTWTAVGAVSNSSALLLEANGDTRLFFQPAANFSGTVTDGITFRAWDETTGTAGTKVDTSTNGGSSAFSSATDTASVTVNAANDAPTIIAPNGGSAFSVSINENTTAVTDIDATDPDAGQTLTYSIVGGADAAKFTISSSTGVLSFISAPDFENLTDAGGNNVYDVLVQVSDGNGGTDTQTIAVTVNNVNDPPSDIIFTGNGALAATTIPDSGTDITRISNNSTLFTLSSVDPDNASGFTYTFSGSAAHGVTVDGSNETFTMGGSSGAVTTSQLDYDNGVQTIAITTPRTQDPGGNTRVETVTLRLGTNTSGDSIDGSAVVNDQVIYGFAGGDTLKGGSGRDSIYGGGDDDTIVGAANDIELDGGSGTDTLEINANFTSTSNAQIVNIETVQLTGAVTLNLANQTEGFKIIGSSGIDTITGGSGSDTINAGAGNDTLTGNGGADQFRLSTNGGSDLIADYVDGTDKIGFFDNGSSSSGSVNFASTAGSAAGTALNGSDFLTVNNISDISNSHDDKVIRINNGQTTSAIQTTTIGGSGSPDDNYVIVFNTNTSRGEIWYDSDWSNTADRMKVATLDNVTTLAQLANITASDIVVYNSAVDPIVLDLGQEGISFTSLENGVGFDINHDGAQDQIAWTANGDDGILALDLDGSGKIEGGKELFTPDFNGGQFADGIAALESLDGNHDGVIDGQDQAFGDLVVWQDANHNGVSETGELAKLGDLGITSISLNTTPGGSPIDGQHIAGTGSFTYADGSTGTYVEVDLDASLGTASAQPDSHPAEDHDLSVFAAMAAEIDYGGGDIDLSGLQQPGADHAPAPQTQGAEAGHAGVDAGATTPAAITIMHEQAALAMQLAAS
jgi:T1SS-143 domain-containing protein